MGYMHKSIEEIHEALKNNKVTVKELINESLEKSRKLQEECNAFVTILDDAKEVEVTDNLLSGIPYGIKDNYSTKGILSTGSSNTLKDYVPFFNATSIEKLENAGAVPTNKTVMDEFGMGGTGTTGHTGIGGYQISLYAEQQGGYIEVYANKDWNTEIHLFIKNLSFVYFYSNFRWINDIYGMK